MLGHWSVEQTPEGERLVTGITEVRLRPLDNMSIEQMIDMLVDMGYSAEGLSNDEIYDMLVSVMDGHGDEGGVEELDFSDD